jgi:HEAT repeat protein
VVPPTGRTPDDAPPPPPPTPGAGGGGGTTPSGGGSAPAPGVPLPPRVSGGGGGGSNPGGSGATPGGRGGRKSDRGESRWEYWWANNGYHHYRFGAAADELSSGSADFLLGKTDRDAARSIEHLSERVREQSIVPALREALGYMREDHEIRAAAVKALGRVGGKAAIGDIEKLLEDEHIHVRYSAALALGFTRAPEAAPILRRVVADRAENLTTRAFAATAIGMTGDVGSAEFLKTMARDQLAPYDVRAAVLVALGLLGDSSCVPFLASVLSDRGNASLRALAAISLAKLGGPDAISALEKSVRDSSTDVRRSVAIGLGRAGAGIEDAEARARLTTLLQRTAQKDSDVQARCFATISLGQIGGAAARKFLLETLRDGTHALKAYAALALGLTGDPTVAPFIREALETRRSDVSTRSAMAIALGLLRDRSASPLLLAIVDAKGDPELRGYAAVALGMIGERAALPAVERALRSDSDPNLLVSLATAMGLLGDRSATSSLLEELKRTDSPFTRASLITALGFIKDRSAVEPLARILADSKERPLSRIYAAIGLGYVGDARVIPPLADLTKDFNYLVSIASLDELVALL